MRIDCVSVCYCLHIAKDVLWVEQFDIGFVILTWNSEQYIKKCIESIFGLNNFHVAICVVDNGSKDRTVQILKELQEKSVPQKMELDIICLRENKGTTVSRNLGIKKILSRIKNLCILDSDTVINQNAVQDMLQVLYENKKNGIVGPRMETSAGLEQQSGRNIPSLKVKLLKVMPIKTLRKKGEAMERVEHLGRNVIPVGYIMSACWFIRAEVVREIGLLDEKIFYAPEDVEYCLRAWKNGYRVLLNYNAKIIHEWQRLSRKKLFSKHNWEHIKGLAYLYTKYGIWFSKEKYDCLIQ